MYHLLSRDELRAHLSRCGVASAIHYPTPLGRRHPDVDAFQSFDDVLLDRTVEAVIIATPPQTHYPLAKRALKAGKHVLVEKPVATRLADGRELADLAKASGLTLMPGHTFIYSPAVNAVRELIRTDVIGDIHFITSSRMNLGNHFE